MRKKVVVIVDGCSSGKTYAKKLLERGIPCVHVRSTPKIPKVCLRDFHPEDYLEKLVFHGRVDPVIKALSKYNVLFVIPGCELGVELADLLSEELNLFTNGAKLSPTRRNKFAMIAAIKQAGLQTVEHIKASDVNEIIKWSRSIKSWPIVLKPLKSAASDQVFFCNSEQEIVAAFNEILSNHTFFGLKNDEVLAQSFLSGIEYVANTVSYNGRHFVTDYWRYAKTLLTQSRLIYDYAELLPYNFPQQKELQAYVNKVLDAQGIKYGAAHTEVMLTDQGPVVVESAARIMGAIDQNLIQQAIGQNQADLTLDSYLKTAEFHKRVAKPYKIQKHLMIKFIISKCAGIVTAINFLDKIRALPAFHAINLNVQVGSELNKTIDLITSPGIVVLLHPDKNVLWSSYRELKNYESQMFSVK